MVDSTDLNVILAMLVICGFASAFIAQNRHAPAPLIWFGIGLVFGPLGLVFAWFLAKPARAT